jgi:hypothetical protein
VPKLLPKELQIIRFLLALVIAPATPLLAKNKNMSTSPNFPICAEKYAPAPVELFPEPIALSAEPVRMSTTAFHPAFAVQQRFAFRQKQPVGLSWVFDKSRPSGTDPIADVHDLAGAKVC